MHQRNSNDDMYKISSREFIYRMYHERRLLGVWTISYLSSKFSFSHYILYKSIWAPLQLTHQRNLDIFIYKMYIAKFIYHMYAERGVLGVCLKSHFCAIFVHFFHFLAIIFINQYERLYHWCTRLIFLKYILGSSFTLCITREEYWVYEKKSHLCVIFSILHSNSNHCWIKILWLMNQSKFDVWYNKIHIGSIVSLMHDGRWISDVWKICSFICHFLVSPLKFEIIVDFFFYHFITKLLW